MKIRRPFRNIVLPLTILGPLLSLLVGCIYVPWFEHRIDSGPNPRALIGDVTSSRPIRLGATRETVHRLLGDPEYVSSDGSAVGYVCRNSIGTWVWICGFTEPADMRCYVVRLVFDKKGSLVQVDWADSFQFYAPLRINPSNFGTPEAIAVQKLNQSGPQLVPVDPPQRATTEP